MKKSVLITLITVCMFWLVFFNVPECANAHTAGAWALDSIDSANSSGIIPPDMYAGDYTVPVTRREVAILIVNACENLYGPVQAEQYPFADTMGDAVVNKVCTLGIMNGRDDKTFSPHDNVTRQEMAKIMLEFKAYVKGTELELPVNPKSDFIDFYEVSSWAKPYVAYAVSSKIFSGYDDNTFRGKATVSREMAIALIFRCTDLNRSSKPSVSNLASGSVVSSDSDLTVGVWADGASRIYLKKNGQYSELRTVECNSYGYADIDSSLLDKNSVYILFAECNGVFSNVVVFYTDKIEFDFRVTELSAGKYRISWNRMGGIDVYILKITEQRNSYYKGDIPPNEPVVHALRWEDSMDVYFNPDRTYTVEISGGSFYDIKKVVVPAVFPEGADAIKSSYPTTKEEADALVTTVEVPVWKISNGARVSSTAYLTVHHKIADKVRLVFEEIYNGPERFPIKDVGAYAWRGGRSEHNGGTAIDINANENYCIYNNGTVIGSYWKPYEDIYSITPYGDVVRAFEKYGFTWGGDSWSNPRDYMHFSYLGT